MFHKWIKGGEEFGANPIYITMNQNYSISGYGGLLPPSGGWVSPTGYEDPSGLWSNEPKAYDENLATYATQTIPFGTTSDLILTLGSPILSSKIRFYVDVLNGEIDTIWLKVYIPSTETWLDVYNGSFLRNVWVEKTFGEVTISKVKIYFTTTEGDVTFRVHEFDFFQVSKVPILAVRLGGGLAVLLTGYDKGKVAVLV